MMTAIHLILVCVFTQSQPAAPKPPADWPPLPDFKKPVDYVKWLEGRWAKGKTDDAAPLYAEFYPSDEDSEEVRNAKWKRLGESPDGKRPGLFTGDDPWPEDYAWDPRDHPDWEAAWKVSHRLHDKISALSRKRFHVTPVSAPAEGVAPGGRSSKCNSLLMYRLSFPTPVRPTVKMRLQNAWRSPGGRTDASEMQRAIIACLRIARQHESLTPSSPQFLCGLSTRMLTYDTAFRALEAGVFGDVEIGEIDDFLATQDKDTLDPLRWRPAEIACLLDVLQFAYVPTGGRTGPPRPNRANLTELAKELSALHTALHKLAPELASAPLDLVGEIEHCSPADAIRQLIEHELAARDIVAKELPQDAAAKLTALAEQYEADPAVHVLWRQFGDTGSHVRIITACARAEARRRALRTLFALHREHLRTGQWPASLRAVPLLTPQWRTDPFSRKDFIYRQTADGFTLYSVGANGKDDGGRHSFAWDEGWANAPDEKKADTDHVFWPVQKRVVGG